MVVSAKRSMIRHHARCRKGVSLESENGARFDFDELDAAPLENCLAIVNVLSDRFELYTKADVANDSDCGVECRSLTFALDRAGDACRKIRD